MYVLRLWLVCCAVTVAGCSTAGYYGQLAQGHLALMSSREPIAKALQRDDLQPELRAQLTLAQRARDFASRQLRLPDNDSYRTYTDLGRPYAVWNVVATPALSLEPKTWCFLVVGCLSYRGYFERSDAEAFASQLADEGYDVSVSGARAYSTLGWFEDPLLNTMLGRGEATLVGLIVHELAHQQLYIDDDSTFNESFATAVEREGVRRWFEQSGDANAHEQYLASKRRKEEFQALLAWGRAQLGVVYTSALSDTEKLQRKSDVFMQLRQRYAELKQGWDGYSGYDTWMAQELNNAHLALAATYHELVPAFTALLEASGYDMAAFYRAAADIAALPMTQRRDAMARYTIVAEPALSEQSSASLPPPAPVESDPSADARQPLDLPNAGS